MPKSYNIRWRSSDEEKLQRAINNFNQRLYRQQKKQNNAEWLPQRANYSAAVKSIKTRADFNRFVKSLERFDAKSAEKVESKSGAKTTKWELSEFKRNQRAENKRREKLKKTLGEKEVTQAGKPTGVKRAEMGKIKENAVEPDTKRFETMNQKEWELASKQMEKRMRSTYSLEKRRLWQRNYIKGLIRQGMPNDIIDMVQRVDPDTFAEIIDLDEVATIDFIYDPQELAVRAENIREVWKQYAGDSIKNEIDIEALQNEVALEASQGYTGRHADSWYNKYMQVRKGK